MGNGIIFYKEQGIVPFLQLRLVSLAKLSKGEVDFTRNHGTMPPFGDGAFVFEASRLAVMSKKQLRKSK